MRPFTIAAVAIAAITGFALALLPGAACASSKRVSSPGIHRLVVTPAPSDHHDRRRSSPTSADAAPARHPAERHRPTRQRTGDRRARPREFVREQQARQRQQAEVAARADRIYALARTNAPILTDTRACKRVGALGESIYENCALAGPISAVR